MPKELKNVELFSVGRWNQQTFTEKDLIGVAEAYQDLTGVLRVPLKFGHNDEQPMTDGQPSIGWVGNVRYDESSKKLMGDFVDLPDIVYEAMKNKLYNSLSIELMGGISYKDKKYSYVLEGVALLGADLPAVNTISDLSKYIDNGESEKPVVMSRVSFSNSKEKQPTNEGNNMTVDVAEYERLKAQFSKLQEDQEKKELDFAAKEAKLQEETNKQLFSLKKAALDEKMESLVLSKAITPAQRDVFAKKVVENDLASIDLVADVVSTFSAQAPTEQKGKAQFSKGGDDVNTLVADKEISKRARELQATNGSLSFKAAVHQAMKTDEQLAREYVNLTPEINRAS